MDDVITKIKEIGLVPVIVVNDIDETRDLLSALGEGGVNVAEITFRTALAKEAIAIFKKEFPSFIIGAGTIINRKQAEEAIASGAEFIVSPGLSEEVSRICKDNGVPYVPGAITPTEIMKAIALGYSDLKFFPADVYGGLKAIKALSSVFSSVSFMPTGGVNLDNLSEFAKNEKIFAIGGSFLTKGNHEEIVANCKRARGIIKESKQCLK